MITEAFSIHRPLKKIELTAEFIVVGGGMAGTCAAISAAREGIKVILVQDRPVLGGNASSEVRLWILGATSHMGNNNRWSREGGIIDEILVENAFRNKEGNPVILDSILLEKVYLEPNITLLLNTAVYDVVKSESKHIAKITAFNSQNQCRYEISGKIFCDASGDGIVGYNAGASFRMGAEDSSEYNEKFIPDKETYGELLGQSLYFWSKNTGKPVKFIPPEYANKELSDIPRIKQVRADQYGCKYWWIEYGGRMDAIYDTDKIKWKLWSVVYGIWDYIKNSGKFESVENLTLEWVGLISGKRESRRFLGEYTLIQQDIIEQHHFDDVIAYGGWAIDLHPADGIFSNENGCTQYHSKGIYEIPYRCYVSKDIDNLYFAGRNISASHVAHGSSRVMATSALGGQAIGKAAALCLKEHILPSALQEKKYMKRLQELLNLMGQSIPGIPISREVNKASLAKISASSSLSLSEIKCDGPWYLLDYSVAQMLPLTGNTIYTFKIHIKATRATTLEVELRYSSKPSNYTPDTILEDRVLNVSEGEQDIEISFSKGLPDNRYGFITFLKNPYVSLRMSSCRYSGIVSVFNKFNDAVGNFGTQVCDKDYGVESFEFWCPDRRPQGHNIGMKITPAINDFTPDNIINGFVRPTTSSNAWIAHPEDSTPRITFRWDSQQHINVLKIFFDTDYDHPLESVQMSHPENVMPFCIRGYRIYDDTGRILCEETDNHQTIRVAYLDTDTKELTIETSHPSEHVPASIFQVVIQ